MKYVLYVFELMSSVMHLKRQLTMVYFCTAFAPQSENLNLWPELLNSSP